MNSAQLCAWVRSSGPAAVFALAAGMLSGSAALAQQLTGAWVEQSQQRIDRYRKSDIRIIVLDQRGKHLPQAQVRIEQLCHRFPVGFHLSLAGWPEASGPAWRCSSAVSLERLSGWPLIAPAHGEWQTQPLDRAVARAELLGWVVRWGGMIWSDAGRNLGWLSYLDRHTLGSVLDAYVKRVLRRYGAGVDQFDLYTHSLGHDWVEPRLGVPMVRRLHEHAKAAAPRAAICVRFEDALTADRWRQAVRVINELKQRFILFDLVAIDQRFAGVIIQALLQRIVDQIEKFDWGIVVAGLKVGGRTLVAAAINLEVVLRTLFAEPKVQGIWYTALSGDEASNASLLDADGEPTPAGELFEGIGSKFWWTGQSITADKMGNVYARVFTGTHRVWAALGTGPRFGPRFSFPSAIRSG